MDTSIELEYQITLEEYLDCKRAITESRFNTLLFIWLFKIIIPSFLVFTGLVCLVWGLLSFYPS
jgi:hypothetical protein